MTGHNIYLYLYTTTAVYTNSKYCGMLLHLLSPLNLRIKKSMDIVPRKVIVNFGPIPIVPFDWYDNSPAITEFFHALSVHFPAGETFFIESVAHYAKEIKAKNPALWERVRMFFKQEGMHTHVHELWDQRVQLEFNHNMNAHEQGVAERLGRVKRNVPHLTSLAVTACLEHFTATLARLLLNTNSGRYIQNKSAEPYKSLWRWHAIEELEHKDVAYDVYTLVGGGYIRRSLIMMIVGPLFIMRTLLTWYSLIRERNLPILSSMGTLFKFLMWKPGVLLQSIPSMMEWFLPWYHPSSSAYDNDASIVDKYAKLLKYKENQEGIIQLTPSDNQTLPTTQIFGKL